VFGIPAGGMKPPEHLHLELKPSEVEELHTSAEKKVLELFQEGGNAPFFFFYLAAL